MNERNQHNTERERSRENPAKLKREMRLVSVVDGGIGRVSLNGVIWPDLLIYTNNLTHWFVRTSWGLHENITFPCIKFLSYILGPL